MTWTPYHRQQSALKRQLIAMARPAKRASSGRPNVRTARAIAYCAHRITDHGDTSTHGYWWLSADRAAFATSHVKAFPGADKRGAPGIIRLRDVEAWFPIVQRAVSCGCADLL